mmetsp:Transcript_33210/g.56460  ORF Transcript_33210/g.56460 Transcript_33210/m.56460 type:complete len:96 (+) Transcript_33210:331-618(+)
MHKDCSSTRTHNTSGRHCCNHWEETHKLLAAWLFFVLFAVYGAIHHEQLVYSVSATTTSYEFYIIILFRVVCSPRSDISLEKWMQLSYKLLSYKH